MSYKEIMKEINIRKEELHDLVHELNLQPDKDRGLEIINRMMLLAREISDLETISKNHIRNLIIERKDLFITKLKNIFK